MNCCPPPNKKADKHGFNRIFRGSYVNREQKQFLKRGADKRQQAFLQDAKGSSLLDIGCGVGAIGLTALQKGATQSHFLDISRPYLEIAKDNAKTLNLEEKSYFLEGDFVQLDNIPKTDIISLDRVVCCYPDVEKLLNKAASLSQKQLTFSYPKAYWFMKLGKTAVNTFMRLRGNPYRFFLHDEQKLINQAESSGHSLRNQQQFGIWTVLQFKK